MASNRVLYPAIMNYDVYGSWSASVGPNAPLDDSCAPTQAGSAVSAVKAWTNAKFPVDKVHFLDLLRCPSNSYKKYVQIVLGVTAYGHSFHVNTSATFDSSNTLYPPIDKAQQPLGDSDEAVRVFFLIIPAVVVSVSHTPSRI